MKNEAEPRDVIQWHRIAEFQLVSLKAIATDVLAASPVYDSEPVELFMPGELRVDGLQLPNSVQLFISEGNPGAESAVRELQVHFPGLRLAKSLPRWLDENLHEVHVGVRVVHASFGAGAISKVEETTSRFISSTLEQLATMSHAATSAATSSLEQLATMSHAATSAATSSLEQLATMSHAATSAATSSLEQLATVSDATVTEVAVGIGSPKAAITQPQQQNLEHDDTELHTDGVVRNQEVAPPQRAKVALSLAKAARRLSIARLQQPAAHAQTDAASSAHAGRSISAVHVDFDSGESHQFKSKSMRELKLMPQVVAEGGQSATHIFLYLASDTFVGPAGEQLAAHVRTARAHGFPIVMVHENDGEKGGCDFSRCAPSHAANTRACAHEEETERTCPASVPPRFFETTPSDLICDGLYKDLAVAFMSGQHREVSFAILAKKLGATKLRQAPIQVIVMCGSFLRSPVLSVVNCVEARHAISMLRNSTEATRSN